VPLAHTTFALTTLNPCKLAVVFDFSAFHWPHADVATRHVNTIVIFTRTRVLDNKVQSMHFSLSTASSRSF
jgi:hypothetical protein